MSEAIQPEIIVFSALRAKFKGPVNYYYHFAHVYKRLSRYRESVITYTSDNTTQYESIEVEVSLRITAQSRTELVISDGGPDFDAEDLKNVFARFYMWKKDFSVLGLSWKKAS